MKNYVHPFPGADKFFLFILAALLFAAQQTGAQDFSKWRFYRAVNLNTSASGANVKDDVQHYPVAVTLNAGNFDFTQAKADGADIRFSDDLNGSLLAHSIEHWNQTGQTAVVWVKIPVVRGNSDSQSIFMHWGSTNATDADDSKSVFDTGDGFVGVWHLGDEGSMDDGGYKDATANAANGTGINVGRSARVEGRVGRGLGLRYAANQWVRIGGEKRKLFDITTNLTFSIWAKANSYQNKGDEAGRALPGYETMIAKGDNSWRLQKFGVRDWHKPPADLVEICCEQFPKGDLCVVGKVDMATNQWFHFVGVHEHPKVKLYVNGVLSSVDEFSAPWKSDDHAVGIGNQSQFPDKGRSWDGVLDEARVMNVSKGDA